MQYVLVHYKKWVVYLKFKVAGHPVVLFAKPGDSALD